MCMNLPKNECHEITEFQYTFFRLNFLEKVGWVVCIFYVCRMHTVVSRM